MTIARYHLHILLVCFGVLVSIPITVWYAVAHAEERQLTVAFLDVGQGDAMYVESPTGKQILIDAGAGTGVLRELGDVMPFYDRTIDIVVATHPDQDHIGGIPFVLDTYEVEVVVRSGFTKDTATYDAVNTAIEEEGAQTVNAVRGMVINLGDGAHLDVLHPLRSSGGGDANAASIVARLVYNDAAVMLTGDAPKAIEHHLSNRDRDKLQSDILKVGHHGSDTSTARVFVGFVDPKFAVISAGADNRYGHPHDEVIETLKQFNIDIRETSTGRVVCTTEGREWECV